MYPFRVSRANVAQNPKKGDEVSPLFQSVFLVYSFCSLTVLSVSTVRTELQLPKDLGM